MLLDEIFGAPNFRNEIIWKRTSAHANVLEKFGAVHDCIRDREDALASTRRMRYRINRYNRGGR